MHPPARPVALLLNVAHALDHLFLLIFATAVAAIAADFGFSRWEDLMPYGVGAFLMFGLGSLPAGKLGDSWGRRPMMLVFFFGMGASALLAAATQNAWQLAAALSLLGAFSAIYHPVGIPMLVQGAPKPGATIGINGLSGNLGIAAAALATGFLVHLAGWRAAFVVPGLVCIALGLLFARLVPAEAQPPSRRKSATAIALAPGQLARVLVVMTVASATAGLLFNLTTNGNAQLLTERLGGLVNDPATIGMLLAGVYALASLSQVVVESYLASEDFDARLARAREFYKRRAKALCAAMRRRLPDWRFAEPSGGFAVFAEVDHPAVHPTDDEEWLRTAIEHGVAFDPGSLFRVRPNPRSLAMRLCYSATKVPDLLEAVHRLERAWSAFRSRRAGSVHTSTMERAATASPALS